jgi:hypothetical protein
MTYPNQDYVKVKLEDERTYNLDLYQNPKLIGCD